MTQTPDAAEAFIRKVRADLPAALRAGDRDLTRALRMLVAAVDNAQAVPIDTIQRDPSGDDLPNERPGSR